MTELNDLKEKIDRFSFKQDMLRDPVFDALGLAEEAGEVVGKIRKWWRDETEGRYQDAEMSKKRRFMIATELGDALFNWVYLCDAIGVQPETVFTILLDKIASRKEHGTQAGEGDDR